MRIHQLTIANMECLDRLAPEVFDNAIEPLQLARFLADPRHVMLVATEDDLVVGMASAVEYFHPDKPPQMWINEVGVSPVYRRRGFGRALTAAVVEEARQRGCSYLWLGTMQDNAVAQACFQSVPEATPPQPFLLYEWDLED